MKFSKLAFISLVLLSTATTLSVVFNSSSASAAGFEAGRIIDDAVMRNDNSMTTAQIQTFLNSKMPSCDTWGKKMYNRTQTRAQYAASHGVKTPFVCLKDYSSGGKTAAQIIKEKANQYDINPQVLIVLLQKEQALVTDDWPWPVQYRTATGYGCPDTAPCDSQYYGLANQLDWAAKMFKSIVDRDPNWYSPYVAGYNPKVYWHPDTNRCGGQSLNIQNWSTASLYSYTPYRPNQAALDAGYGTGNSCSSYGNRNFYLYFNDWFGSTLTNKVKYTVIDGSTDKSGETATIGFTLYKKPSANVTLSYAVSSPSNAEMVGTQTVTITPSSWDKPKLNTLTVRGKNNSNLTGTFEYKLLPSSKTVSNDKTYSNISTSYLPQIAILHQDTLTPNNVYRLYNSSLAQHTFTASKIEHDNLVANGWRSEGTAFNYCTNGERIVSRMEKLNQHKLSVNGSQTQKNDTLRGYTLKDLTFSVSSQGSVPVYYRYNDTDPDNFRTLYTRSSTETLTPGSGWKDGGVAFYACASNSKPVYRLYKAGGSHFYTSSITERDKAIYKLGYRYEQLGFYACSDGEKPVYRFYKPSTGVRFYTVSEREKQKIIDTLKDYTYEGVAFKLCSSGDTPVYRHYDTSNGRRFFTTSKSESDSAVNLHGYTLEGVGFKSL